MSKLVKKKHKTCRAKTCYSRLAPDSASGLCINCETAAYRARQKSAAADVTGTNEFILYANAVVERVKLYASGATVRQLKEHFPGSDYWLTLVLNGDKRIYATSRSVGVSLYHFGTRTSAVEPEQYERGNSRLFNKTVSVRRSDY